MKFAPAFAFLLYLHLVDCQFIHRLTCGLHKIGDKVVHHGHHHDPCEKHHPENVTESLINEPDTITKPSKDIRDKADNTSHTPEVVTVPGEGGRHIGKIRANCPKGFIGDGKGNCLEVYS